MAKAFLKAAEIADIAAAEITRLEKERDEAIEAAIVAKVGVPQLRGHFWWKRIHLRTRQEAEDWFYGRYSDSWRPPSYRLEENYNRSIAMWAPIREAALGAIERGDSTVLLDHDEIAAIRAASTEPLAA